MHKGSRIAIAAVLAALLPITGAFAASVVLFEQTPLAGVKDNFYVPQAAVRQKPAKGAFNLVWQANPHRADGVLVPTSWAAGDKTGFYPSQPLTDHQWAFRDQAGSSTVQIDGDTVGAYINTTDLINGSHKDKMMITPSFRVPKEQQVSPFAQPGKALVSSLDVKIPTAAVVKPGAGNIVHASADVQFLDKTSNTKLSFGCNLLFLNNEKSGIGNVGFDEDSQSIMVNGPVSPGSPFTTLLPGSAVQSGQPWKEWRTFKFAITEQNFRAALAAIKQKYPDAKISMNPADYNFGHFHLNAELHHKTGDTELGWSMRHARVTLEDMGS